MHIEFRDSKFEEFHGKTTDAMFWIGPNEINTVALSDEDLEFMFYRLEERMAQRGLL